ncbi:MAG: hypothetical protein GX335_08815 [Firmicutes bacterium]|nr:hypothetical protein [Bacillota bacterium]
MSLAADQIIVVLWHGLDWDQLRDFNFGPAQAWGLLNTRGGGGASLPAAYLSLGAGARAVGSAGAGFFLEEDPHNLYFLHTGREGAAITQPQIALIQEAQKVNYKVVPGALGTALEEAGLQSLALGSSDGSDLVRWAPLVLMDEGGRVARGSIGSRVLKADPGYPFGKRTDFDFLENQIFASQEDLIIVDLGDPYRFDQYQDFFLPSQREAVREKISLDARRFLERIGEKKREGTVIFLLSPYPSAAGAKKGQWLTPALALGLGEGLLSSGTTRWPGLITNMDFAPTILALLGAEHNQPFIGREIFVQPGLGGIKEVQKTWQRITRISQRRSKVLRVFVGSQIALYSLALLALIIKKGVYPELIKALQFLLLVFLAVPQGLLWWAGPRWVFPLWALALFLWVRREPSFLGKIRVIALTTAAALVFDLLRGSWLMRFSYLGYDPIGGARFYGLGNEYMGILIGSAITGWALLSAFIDSKPRLGSWGGLLFFGFILICIGAPALGTNVGGTIAGVFAFGFTWLSLSKKKTAGLLGPALALSLVLGVFLLIDSANPAAKQSHIGQTAELFQRDGFAALGLIIKRKLAMNLKLLRHSIWSKGLLVAVAAVAASFIWPSSFIRWLQKNHPAVAQGICGVVIGSLTALIFNDSGVVAAATCLFFGSTTLLILALELKHDLTAPQAHVKDNGNGH